MGEAPQDKKEKGKPPQDNPKEKGKRENVGHDDFAGFPPDNHSARTHERNETISRLVSPPTSDEILLDGIVP